MRFFDFECSDSGVVRTMPLATAWIQLRNGSIDIALPGRRNRVYRRTCRPRRRDGKKMDFVLECSNASRDVNPWVAASATNTASSSSSLAAASTPTSPLPSVPVTTVRVVVCRRIVSSLNQPISFDSYCRLGTAVVKRIRRSRVASFARRARVVAAIVVDIDIIVIVDGWQCGADTDVAQRVRTQDDQAHVQRWSAIIVLCF
jgi:hypothetical protein